MKLYRRETFLQLPEGTIYAKGKRWYFGGLKIKAETTSAGNDWWSLDPCWVASERGDDAFDAFGRLDEMLNRGTSYPMQDALGRDGHSEDDALFLVFERADLEVLRGAIDAAITLCDDSKQASSSDA